MQGKFRRAHNAQVGQSDEHLIFFRRQFVQAVVAVQIREEPRVYEYAGIMNIRTNQRFTYLSALSLYATGCASGGQG